jgi:hypothetical protein
MLRYDDAYLSYLRDLIDQMQERLSYLRRHDPVFIEMGAEILGLRRSKDGSFYYPVEFEWLYKEQSR